MKRLTPLKTSMRPITTEMAVAASLEVLDATSPGWSERSRLEGALRRVRRDSSEEGLRAATRIYGSDTVARVVRSLGLLAAETTGGTGQPAANPAELSPREIEVLRLLKSGKRLAEVAVELGVSSRTASEYMRRVRLKLASTVLADRRVIQNADD